MLIDGRKTAPRGSVLDACRAAGAEVPAFCSDHRVAAAGHCRACIVEVDGRLVAACTTAARDDMKVVTNDERLRAYRRDLAELMAAEATLAGRVADELASLGVEGHRYAAAPRSARRDESHPYLRLDLESCIRCRLCLGACSEIQGQFVYAMEKRGAKTELTWGDVAFADTSCVACGACAAVCPTGAVTDVDHLRVAGREPERVVRTTCGYCGVGCQLEAHVFGGDVALIEGGTSPVNREHLCVKGRYAHAFTRHPDRLTTPLIRRDGKLEPATWAEAIETVAREMTRLRGHLAGLSSSRCTNEENYLFQKWFRAGFGTNHVDCCARVCHGPSAAGMRRSFGAGAATNSFADLERADLILVAGSNATEGHPIVGARIRQAALGGTKLVVVDPRRTELARMADVHLQLRPGTNVPLLNSLAAVLVEEGLVDRRFVDARSEGFAEYEPFIRRFAPEAVETVTGVPAADVRRAARMYAAAARPMQVHGLGMTEHLQGSESVMLLCNLAVLVGAVGREGVGVNPLRGQNNVQGAADMGCQPDLLTGYQRVEDAAVRERVGAIWDRPVPSERGLTLPRIYEAIRAGHIRGMFVFGEDVVQTDPDCTRVIETLARLELLVVQELFLSETARLAHVVLPGASFLEKDGTFTNGERRVQRVRRAIEPPGEARPDWRILCDLMAATGIPQPFAGPADVMEEVARVAPSFAGISYPRLEGDGLHWPVPAPEENGTAILHRERFARGRAVLACVDFVPSPALAAAEERMLLVTGRALEHYNSGSMTRRTDNLRLRARDLLEIHPADAGRLGISDGDEVAVASDSGEARMVAEVNDGVRAGTLFATFHDPASGTNRVTSDVVDRIADCPEYKVTAVEVRKIASGGSA